MFAPYCPTCQRRILLGTGRIVAARLEEQPMSLHLRCFCGTVVRADSPPPPAGTTVERVA